MNHLLQSLCMLLAIISWQRVDSQKEHNNWYFGQHAGITFNTPVPSALKGSLNTTEGVASISDKNGNLLFYTDGVTVYDRNHQQMFNGFGLAGGESSSQSAMIIPAPQDPNRFYVFTAKQQTTPGGLYFSIVDMRLQNGLGDVVAVTKNSLVLENTAEKQTAVQHVNRRDIWIVTHTMNNNSFYAFLLTPSGINPTPMISTLGTVYGSGGNWPIGLMKASHHGSVIAANISYLSIFEIFDFDRASGKLSNARSIPFPQLHARPYGLEFSPSDSLLYIGTNVNNSQGNFIYQYNYLDATPFLDTISYNFSSFNSHGSFQIAPDGQLYVAKTGYQALDIIHKPDNRGDACQYEEEGIHLLDSTRCAFGLPWPYLPIGCETIDLGEDKIACLGNEIVLALSSLPTNECPFTFTWFDGTHDTTKTIDENGNYWIDIMEPDTSYRDYIRVTFESSILSNTDVTLCEGNAHEGYTSSGIYIDTFTSAFGCDSIRALHLSIIPTDIDTVIKSILTGTYFEGYSASGVYKDTFVTVFGCDSFRTLFLTVLDTAAIIHYTLDACVSVMANGTHMDYSEFTPGYPDTLPCASVSAQHVYRISPEKHSCTLGPDNNIAMCVTASPNCEYEPGSNKSVIIEFTIDPPADSLIQITQFNFYEKSPFSYSWINGASGPNDRPVFYGIRIFKNDVVIFLDDKQVTQPGWNIEAYYFEENPHFRCNSTSHFRIELLPYCPDGNGATESVWDLDQINVYAACVPILPQQPLISGTVRYADGHGMNNVHVEISADPAFTSIRTTTTDSLGLYVFDELNKNSSYYIRCYNNDDVLLGVSAADILRIKKHLLGIDPYLSLQQLVASDINRNNNLNALDLIAFQKTLLGIHAGFPNNTSWRFGIVPQDFGLMRLSAFKEDWHIEALQGSLEQLDFIGIKVGDLH